MQTHVGRIVFDTGRVAGSEAGCFEAGCRVKFYRSDMDGTDLLGDRGVEYRAPADRIRFPSRPGDWDGLTNAEIRAALKAETVRETRTVRSTLLASEITFTVQSIWEDEPGQIEAYDVCETTPDNSDLKFLGYAVYMVARGLSQYVADFDAQGDPNLVQGTVEAEALYRQAVELQAGMTQALEWLAG